MVDRNDNNYSVADITLDPSSVAADTSAEEIYDVEGLTPDMFVNVSYQGFDVGIGIVGCRVPATDKLAITFMNATASPVDPASGTYKLFWWKNNAQENAVKL